MQQRSILKAYEKIKDCHVTQRFQNNDNCPSLGELTTYYRNLYNDALYLVDCRNMQVETLSENFREIIGIENDHIRDLIDLYATVDHSFENVVFEYTEKIIYLAFKMKIWIETEKDIFQSVYKTRNGNTVLKTTSALYRDSSGSIRYTIGRIQDISHLVVIQNFRYQFDGPNRQQVFTHFHGLSEFKDLLSAREIQILNLVGQGYTSKRIAEKLFISKNTVDTHRRHILHKLESSGSLTAYNKARDMGLFYL